MKVGIVAEGKGDFAVIKNIVKSLLALDDADIRSIRPKLDETDAQLKKNQLEQKGYHPMEPEQYSSWELVREECISKTEIQKFLFTEGDKLLVVHIDTAERTELNYNVVQPSKGTNLETYTNQLRANVIDRIGQWLGAGFDTPTAFAIAIEETEAWLIPLYSHHENRDTCRYNDPKRELFQRKIPQVLSRKALNKLRTSDAYDKMDFLSGILSKKKSLQDCRDANLSLELFCTEIEAI